MPVARIFEVFQVCQEEATSHAADAASAGLTDAARPWGLPDSGWAGDPLAIHDLSTPLDRTEINQAYGEILSGDPPGTTGELIATALQGDRVAGRERALRLRLSSFVRESMHRLGRKRGHGKASGVHGNVLRYVQDILRGGLEST